MSIVLGIDAAWTATQPSGVALLDTSRPNNTCIAAAPSYGSFLALAKGHAIDWEAPPAKGEAPVTELLAACEALTGKRVDVVAIDMPMSREKITGLREADQAVSRQFGGRWCATHSPNESRPGQLGARLTHAFLSHSYPVGPRKHCTPHRIGLSNSIHIRHCWHY